MQPKSDRNSDSGRRVEFRLTRINLFLLVWLIFYAIAPLSADTPRLHTDGNLIKDPSGDIVVLRGVSLIDLGFLESWQGGAINMVDRLTDPCDTQGSYTGWYPNVVRIPIVPADESSGWPNRFYPDNNNFYNNILRPVVDYCASKDLYVIIDWHYIDNTFDHVETTSAFWEYMAPRFAGDSHVLFELYNEPTNFVGTETANWLSVREDMHTWIDIVRTYAPDNLILVAGPSWSQAIGPAADYPVTGDNIVIVSHIYPGHWRNPSGYMNHIETCAEMYPILMTEWGFSQSGSPDPCDLLNGTITGYGRPLMDYIEGLQIGNTAWVASYDWGPPMFWTDWTLRCGEGEMGCFVKDTLYLRRNDDQPSSGGNNTPNVLITSPANDASFTWGDNITITADASDSDGTVARVEFLQGATKLGEDTSWPYSYTWNDVPAGHYYLRARATDNDDTTTNSSVIHIIVSGEVGTGAILREWWEGISGTSVSDLTSHGDYPDNPTGRVLITTLEGPNYWTNDYGTRIRGYVHPPVSGNYTFWVASDDRSELYLSTDDNPANATLIAQVTGWTGYQEWDKYAQQESSSFSLTAGQKYYIEVLHKEGGGGDHIEAAWEGPGISRQIIDGVYMSPCRLDLDIFADLSEQYGRDDCNAGNLWCNAFDFNHNGTVTLEDLLGFIENWLH